jgi:hypothetical protein
MGPQNENFGKEFYAPQTRISFGKNTPQKTHRSRFRESIELMRPKRRFPRALGKIGASGSLHVPCNVCQ